MVTAANHQPLHAKLGNPMGESQPPSRRSPGNYLRNQPKCKSQHGCCCSKKYADSQLVRFLVERLSIGTCNGVHQRYPFGSYCYPVVSRGSFGVFATLSPCASKRASARVWMMERSDNERSNILRRQQTPGSSDVEYAEGDHW